MADDERDAYRMLQVRPDAHDAVIRAAYRALAAMYHPDRDPSDSATRRMADLNRAYDLVRSPDRRALYDRREKPANQPPPVVPVPPAPQHGQRHDQVKAGPEMIDFGRYAGWTIKQLSRHDPDYLRWLSRHSSGIRYRRAIAEALDAAATPKSAPASKKRGRR